jgi:malonyl-CoA/methylmalonyl-CoA synthetase
MVLSTKEHHEIMESISTKCSTRYSLLPAVESIPPKIDSQEPLSSELTSSVSSLMAEIDSLKKIKGE